MRIVIFGATGMIGQGVLEACLRDEQVTDVLAVGRTPTGRAHLKLRELAHDDFADFTTVQNDLVGFDACFYCLGTSAFKMSETQYRRVSYDFPLAAARALLTTNPDLVFTYVSGVGTDSTGTTRMMWARVKGETENALLALSPRAYMFRPAFVLPLPGTTSKTALYVVLYKVLGPLYPVLRRIAPRYVTTSLQLSHAMIRTAGGGMPRHVLATAHINQLAAS